MARMAPLEVHIADLPEVKAYIAEIADENDRLHKLLHDIAVARRGDCPDVDTDLDSLPEEIEDMWKQIKAKGD